MSRMSEYRELINEYLPRPIRNEADHRRALRQIEQLMTPHPSPAQGMLIEVLSTLIEQHEALSLPTPRVPPREMLSHCLEARELTAAQLARDTGIGHGTLSNVLAGRRGISKANAARLASYFHLPVAAFLDSVAT